MNRTILAVLAVLALVALPAAAQAKIATIGQTTDTTAPSCPRNCIVVTRTTGYQVRIGSERNRFVVPQDGRIVAWTITLSKPSANQIRYFERRASRTCTNCQGFGAATAGISVVRFSRSGVGRVIGASPLIALKPYFGQTTDFPLAYTIRVRKGDVVALTVPSWAPALGFLPRRTDVSWRASRPGRCQSAATQAAQTAQTSIGQSARYRCLYQEARLEYSATLVTNPKPATKG